MREVSIQTMQRYLHRYRGKGVFLSRWHVDMKCYIINEHLADHAKPSIETPAARIACVPAIKKGTWITSGGHVYTGLSNYWMRLKGWYGTFRWRCKTGWFDFFYRIAQWRMKRRDE